MDEILRKVQELENENPVVSTVEPIAEIQDEIVEDTSEIVETENTPVEAVTQTEEAELIETPAVKSWLDDDDEPVKATDQYTELLKAEFGINDFSSEKIYNHLKTAKPVEAAPDPVLQNPIVQQAIALVKGESDIQKFVEALGAEDPATKSAQDLYRAHLLREGIEGEDLDEAMELFNEQPAYKQKLDTKPILKELQAERQRKLEELNAATFEKKQKADAMWKTGVTEIQSIASGFVGKEYKGMKVTAEQAKGVEKDLLTNFDFYGVLNGRLDTQRLFEDRLLVLRVKDLVKQNLQRGTTEGAVKILNDLHQPSKNTTSKSTTVHSGETDEELAMRLLRIKR